MADYLLHQGATVQCLHPPGQALPTTFSLRVRVSGRAVVTQPTPYIVTGCNLSGPPQPKPFCVTASWISAAARVRSEGAPVLLRSSQATCVSTGTGLNVIQTQMRVRGT